MLKNLLFDDSLNIKRAQTQELPHIDPCKKQVYDLQKCLSAHGYQEAQCQQCIQHLGNCCEKFGDRSFVCSGMRTLDQFKRSEIDDVKVTSAVKSTEPKDQGLMFTLSDTLSKFSLHNIQSWLNKDGKS